MEHRSTDFKLLTPFEPIVAMVSFAIGGDVYNNTEVYPVRSQINQDNTTIHYLRGQNDILQLAEEKLQSSVGNNNAGMDVLKSLDNTIKTSIHEAVVSKPHTPPAEYTYGIATGSGLFTACLAVAVRHRIYKRQHPKRRNHHLTVVRNEDAS